MAEQVSFPKEDESLLKWLEAEDLEDYETIFREKLGVKKVKHLKLIEGKDLDQIGMLPLEKKRFFNKHTQEFNTPSVQKKVVQKETVQMPSNSFGHMVVDVSHAELMKQYGSLYYVSPRNFKQRKTNEFILKMCAGAKWRFATKSGLEDWARKERRMRCVALQVFGEPAEIKDETAYYKDQCILNKLQSTQQQFADIGALKLKHPNGVPDSIFRQKQGILSNYIDELEHIHQNATESKLGIQRSLDDAKGKYGRKEEEYFWTNQIKQADKVMGVIQHELSSVQKLLVSGGEKTSVTLKNKEATRKKTLNIKTNKKRLSKAADVLASGVKKRQKLQLTTLTGHPKSVNGRQNTIKDMLCQYRKKIICHNQTKPQFQWKYFNIKLDMYTCMHTY